MKARPREHSSSSDRRVATGSGWSAIEASKIAGYATVSMTGDYTVVQLQRQDDLTRAIQERVAAARKKQEEDDSTRAEESAGAAA